MDIEIILLSLLVLERVLDLERTEPRLLVLERVGESFIPVEIMRTGETRVDMRSLEAD